MIHSDPSPKAVSTKRRSDTDRAHVRLASAVILKAAKDYRDHPIYNDRLRQGRDVIGRFLRGQSTIKIWHHIGGFTADNMERLIEFAEGGTEFRLEHVLSARGDSIEEELEDVEHHIKDMEDEDEQ